MMVVSKEEQYHRALKMCANERKNEPMDLDKLFFYIGIIGGVSAVAMIVAGVIGIMLR